jgi:hypothetical protein
MKTLRFVQIVTGEYTFENGTKQHCIYGLDANGKVYRYQRTPSPGWVELDPRCKVRERTER